FGVVTEFEFRLHRVDGAALTADLFYAPGEASTVLRRWRDLIAEAPRQATLTAWAGMAQGWPFLPTPLHGRTLVSLGYVWVGDPDQGERLLRALRDARRPVAERVDARTYVELQSMDDDRDGPHLRRYWKGHYLRALDDAALEAFASRGAGPDDNPDDPAFLPGGRLQTYGGEIGAVGQGDTAFDHRGALVEFVAGASWSSAAED